MSSPNDASMEEIPLEDDERDSIEYKILMAYAQRRLSVSKYGKLLKNEAKMRKSSSLTGRKVKIDHQRDEDGLSLRAVSHGGPSQRAVFQGGVLQQPSKSQPKNLHLPGYCIPFFCSRAKQKSFPEQPLQQGCTAHFSISEARFEGPQEWNSQHQTSETPDVNHIADKLAKLVTSRSQESHAEVSFKTMCHALSQEQSSSTLTDGSEGEEKIIQRIVSLLRQSGDQLEETIKKDKAFYQHFKDMLSYTFFKRITDLFLEDVSAGSTSEPEGQIQCTKVAFIMEVATRLTAVDNHPMNLVLGFGSKYLREHFKPWIQDQGGWEKALTSLDQEEVE